MRRFQIQILKMISNDEISKMEKKNGNTGIKEV